MSSAIALLPKHEQHGFFEPEQCILIHNVSWQSYVVIGEALRDRPALRLTYDQGNLELMTTSSEHERLKHLLGMFIQVLAEELTIPLMGLGSATHQLEDLARGLEADECYYTVNFAKVRGKKQIDLNRDPPPDLAVEVEISRSALNRMSIYAALRIPEIWRFNGKKISVFICDKDGQYHQVKRSPTFPDVPLKELVRLANMRNELDDARIGLAFRAWVRERFTK